MRDRTADFIARQVATAVLAGDWTRPVMRAAIAQVFGPISPQRQTHIAKRLLAQFGQGYPPSPGEIVAFLREIAAFDALAGLLRAKNAPLPVVLASSQFVPVPRFAGLEIPAIATTGDLARWLGLPVEHLDWYADAMRQHGRTDDPDLLHYSYAFIPKRVGPPRLIEAPKPRMKTIQRRILHEILDKVPVHDAAHGFVVGRSCLTGAVRHTGQAMVVTVDLADFFTTTPLRRVHAMFRSLGYPWAVARCLTGLCSTTAPASVFDRIPAPRRHTREAMRAYREPHLAQGAPSSPALANLAAYRLDLRLAGLAKAYDATYTRYADDLSFSGDDAFARKANSLLEAVGTIVEDEGYALNPRKTRLMRASARQTVTGIVVNDHMNVARGEFDRLKATLYNCLKNGPTRENRDDHPDFRAHLDGRINWVENLNPARAARLRAIFNSIPWDQSQKN